MNHPSEIRQLRNEIQQLKQTVSDCQEQIEAVEAKVEINLATVVEENQNLRFRVDPFSNSGNSLADYQEI